MYFIALVHELSHVITAMIFKMKIENIKFMPFGFSAEFIDFEREKWYKQLIVIIMGPLSFFITGFLLALMYKNGFLSYYGYKVSNNSNLFVALFNLIPFYPLDGGRAVDILLAGLLSEGWTRLLRYAISFLALLGIGYMSFVMKQIPLFIYLLILFIVQIFYAKKDYVVYLLKRLSEKNDDKIKFVNRDEVFRYRHCLKMTKRGIEDETTIIKKLLLRLNRHGKGKKK